MKSIMNKYYEEKESVWKISKNQNFGAIFIKLFALLGSRDFHA